MTERAQQIEEIRHQLEAAARSLTELAKATEDHDLGGGLNVPG